MEQLLICATSTEDIVNSHDTASIFFFWGDQLSNP